MSEDTVFFLVPDRANLEIALMDAEGRFRLLKLRYFRCKSYGDSVFLGQSVGEQALDLFDAAGSF